MNKRILFTSILLSTLSVFAANVPEFRGEGRTGIYNETGLAKTWAKDGPALLWKNENATTLLIGEFSQLYLYIKTAKYFSQEVITQVRF